MGELQDSALIFAKMRGFVLLRFLCVIGIACGELCAGGPVGEIVYSGETDSGWQVFRRKIPEGKPVQVTFSPGDKRRPMFVPGRDWIVCKDSQGRALTLKKGEESVLDPAIRSVGDVAVSPKGDWLYFTRLAVNNPQRQFIWRSMVANGEEGDPMELVLRPEQGSFRQVSLSPDGTHLAATHIWKVGEERIVVIPLTNPEEFFYVSPEGREAFSPTWSSDGAEVFFSMKSNSEDYDLFRASLVDREPRAVLQAEGTSEWFPSVSRDGEWLVCEQVDKGKSGLLLVNLRTGEKNILETPHAAKEPAWGNP